MVRLGIPVAAAAVIATVLLAAWPDAHLRAAALTGSAWLAMDSSGAPTLAHFAREVGLDSLLLGYREATLFAPLAGRLPPMEHSLDAPFWSLHLELYGSLLVLCLVSLRARSAWLHRAAIAAAAVAVRHASDVPVRARSPRVHAPAPQRRGTAGEGLPSGALLLAARHLRSAPPRIGRARTRLRLWLAISSWRAAQPVPVPEPACGAALYLRRVALPRRLAALERRSVPSPWAPVLRHLSAALPDPVHLGLPGLHRRQRLRCRYAASLTVIFVLFIGLTLFAAIAFERWIDRPAIALSRRAGAFTSASLITGAMRDQRLGLVGSRGACATRHVLGKPARASTPSSRPLPASSRGGTDQSAARVRATSAAASSLRSSSGSTDRAVAGSTPLVVAGRAVE